MQDQPERGRRERRSRPREPLAREQETRDGEPDERERSAGAVDPLEPLPLGTAVTGRRERQLRALAGERGGDGRAEVERERGEPRRDRHPRGEREARREGAPPVPEQTADDRERERRVGTHRGRQRAGQTRRRRALVEQRETEGAGQRGRRRQRFAPLQLEVEAGDQRERAEQQRDRHAAPPRARGERGQQHERAEGHQRAGVRDVEPRAGAGPGERRQQQGVTGRRGAEDARVVVPGQPPAAGEAVGVPVGDVAVVVRDAPEAARDRERPQGEQQDDRNSGRARHGGASV